MASASPRRKPVTLGVVGSAALWEDSYREVIRRQAKPVVLRGVYHPVPALADQAARDWQGWVAPSLTNLFERPEIDGVLVFDTAWQGWYALELAVRFRKPTLITGPWGDDIARLERIHLAAREAGVLLMAAFPRRHCPATNRLRELMATKLGPPKSLTADIPSADQTQVQLIDWIDWCSSILGRQPTGIAASQATETPGVRVLELRFSSSELSAEIRFRSAAGESLRIDCRNGSAVITGDQEIAWTVDSQETRETLTTDRASTEIILDQFCRRVVGGLVPVSDLGDVLRSMRLAQSVHVR